MARLNIAGTVLEAKGHECVPCLDLFEPMTTAFLPKTRPGLWLYVNVTDACNAACPFCASGAGHQEHGRVNPEAFAKTLKEVAPHISGLSFTGGEPTLHMELLNELAHIADDILGMRIELDLATNGASLARLAKLPALELFSSVHISRHSISDAQNRALMRWQGAPAASDIAGFIHDLDDPGKVVLNCVLQKGGVETCDDAADYLNAAIAMGVHNTSFITMFQANDYCRTHWIPGSSLPFSSDADLAAWNAAHHDPDDACNTKERAPDASEGCASSLSGKTDVAHFRVWNRHRDYDDCRCLSGSYKNARGITRFYCRFPGTCGRPGYCRQLVYTCENILQDGFGQGRARILPH